LCLAESCTGGLIGHRITNIAGSSAYLLGGVVAYSYESKMQILNVREATLLQHGAVSEQVADEMVRNVRALFGADYALSVTGIAGPGGGLPNKPVGLTYIGLASPVGVVITRHVWDGDRESNKAASAEAALALLAEALS
jgi:PncC family amidohydrolase